MSLFNRLDWQRIGVVVETDYRRHVFSVGFVGLVVMHVAVIFFKSCVRQGRSGAAMTFGNSYRIE